MTFQPLPVTDAPVPVFGCHVLLRKPQLPGEPYRARCANAPTVMAEGSTERDVLMAIVTRFKFFLHEHRVHQQPPPFQSPPLTPVNGEVERFIPVHL